MIHKPVIENFLILMYIKLLHVNAYNYNIHPIQNISGLLRECEFIEVFLLIFQFKTISNLTQIAPNFGFKLPPSFQFF